MFGKIKQFRRITTWYKMLKINYFKLLHLTLGFLRLEQQETVNTPYAAPDSAA